MDNSQKLPESSKTAGSDVKEKWSLISNAIQHIYMQSASNMSFQQLYTSCYLIVLAKQGEFLYSQLEETIKNHVHQCQIEIDGSRDLLTTLLAKWDRHRASMISIRDIVMYMDRNYVSLCKPPRKPIYELGLSIFLIEVLKHPSVLERLQRAILDAVRCERNGELTPARSQIKHVTDMLCEMGYEEVYVPLLEIPLLEESRRFYSSEAAQYFDQSSTPDFLRRVKTRLQQESNQIDRSFDSRTKHKLLDIIKSEMVGKYVTGLIEKEGSGVNAMLADEAVEDLKLVYEVFGMVSGGLSAVINMTREFIRDQGIRIVSDRNYEGRPKELIEEIMFAKNKHDSLLMTAFSNVQGDGRVAPDKDFLAAINKAFDDAINSNPRFAESLSLYTDLKLKNGKDAASDADLEDLSENVIGLFRYIRDKDLFETHYKRHLSKRLLSGRSISSDAERVFISKLKTECGYQFTSKLEGMFKDIALGKDLMEKFRPVLASKAEEVNGTDLCVQVLTTGCWPITAVTNCVLPPHVAKCCQIFDEFYTKSHAGRQLKWQLNMGSADIRATFKRRTYTLDVSTYQMILLTLFNDSETLSFNELLEMTKIPESDLKRSLLALCNRAANFDRVLVKKPSALEIKPTDTFTCNENFSSKLQKVKITPVVLKESAEESAETFKLIDQDRKAQVDSCIVRVMKSRKTMEHRELILEVTQQLAPRFLVSSEDIKKRIETLIERDYLRRSDESRSRYEYLA